MNMAMVLSPLVAGCLLLAGSADAAGSVLYAGSGNCDGSDGSCVSGPWGLWSFSASGGKLTPLEKLPMSGLPSWTKVDSENKCLFVTVTDSHYVLSYAIGASGKLSLTSNATLAPAMNPVFIDKVGDFIVVANYHGPDGGTDDDGTAGVSSLKVGADCTLTAGSFLPAHGHSVDPGRQGMSHIHSTNALPGSSTKFIACDLGADALISMSIDPATGEMAETSRLNATQGAGPRHMAFHPKAAIAYTLFEMGSFVGVYKISPTDGSLAEAQRITTLPNRKVFSGYTKAAEIVLTPDSKFLLLSNRGFGPDSGSIAVFPVDGAGMLGQPVVTQVRDRYPRGVAIVPASAAAAAASAVAGSSAHATRKARPTTVLVAGQSGSQLTTYTIEPSGALTFTGLSVAGPPNPTTVSFAEI